jgi:hypothetical protein
LGNQKLRAFFQRIVVIWQHKAGPCGGTLLASLGDAKLIPAAGRAGASST